MTEPERKIGDGSMNVPFEPDPVETTLDLSQANFSGGMALMACTVPVDLADGSVFHAPGLVFRFSDPDGRFYNPMALVLDPEDLSRMPELVTQAVARAIEKSEEQNA